MPSPDNFRKFCLLGLIAFALMYLFVEIVIFYFFIDTNAKSDVTFPEALFFALFAFLIFRGVQLTVIALEWPLTMFACMWLNMNFTLILLARFVRDVIRGSTIDLMFRRFLMLFVETLVPFLTWRFLNQLQRNNKFQIGPVRMSLKSLTSLKSFSKQS